MRAKEAGGEIANTENRGGMMFESRKICFFKYFYYCFLPVQISMLDIIDRASLERILAEMAPTS